MQGSPYPWLELAWTIKYCLYSETGTAVAISEWICDVVLLTLMNSVHRQVVRSQLLVELEEALEYRMLLGTESGEARRQIISQVWNDRLSAVSAHIDICTYTTLSLLARREYGLARGPDIASPYARSSSKRRCACCKYPLWSR